MPSSDFGILAYDWKNFPNFKVLLPTLLNNYKNLFNGFNSILDRLLNCYSNTNYRSSSNCCNKQITQAAREDKLGCLEEVFTILPVSICSLSIACHQKLIL